MDLVAIFKYYDDDDNGTIDLKEARNALKDLFIVSKRSFRDYPAWSEKDNIDEVIIAEEVKKLKDYAPEGREIRLDFAEFSTLAMEFARFSTLNMIELKHREKHSEEAVVSDKAEAAEGS